MRYAAFCFLAALLWFGVSFTPRSDADYVGKLNAELSPNDNFNMTVRFVLASDAERRRLPPPMAAGDQVFVKVLKWPPEVGQPLAMMLVEPVGGAPYLYADTNLDGAFSLSERFPFPAFKSAPGAGDELVLRLPFAFSATIFQTYPVTLRPYLKDGTSREVSYSNKAYVTGFVPVGERRTLVRYGIDARTGKADPALEGLGMDTNGDGRIDASANSPELDFGNHGVAVFRVGDRYVSTQSIDAATGVVVLKSHPASDYERLDLTVGTQLPDFSFTDFSGRARKLSDFRGKYVLLDFWGTWCQPCRAEVPFLKDLYGTFRARDFEIIGMDNEVGWDDPGAAETAKATDAAKSFVAQRGIEWTQARTDSIRELVNRRFRVRTYPMKLLLDERGRVVLNVEAANNQDLIPMLDRLLPRRPSARQ
jgi:thiol-disulfide isomerase/thioredoxin